MKRNRYAQSRLKRGGDILIASIGIVLCAPILVCASIAVLLDGTRGPLLSDGPMRLGRGGRKITVYKFRSMIPDADNMIRNRRAYAHLRSKQKEKGKLRLSEDPRITAVGKIIRNFDIDELPQLFNVLTGTMSIVGPRPYFERELLDGSVPKKERAAIMSVRPGMTGIWQVSGRNNLSFHQRVELDAGYAKNASLLEDMRILLRTPKAVIFRKGAW